jgi:hypothetical protein
LLACSPHSTRVAIRVLEPIFGQFSTFQ